MIQLVMGAVVATTEELQALLTEAETAYHDLCIGNSVRVMVHQNGTRVEYTPANRFALQAYINDLKRQLGVLTNVARPMRVWF